jgi:hypothetical protein
MDAARTPLQTNGQSVSRLLADARHNPAAKLAPQGGGKRPMIVIREQRAARRDQLVIWVIVVLLAALAMVWCHQCARMISG